MPVHTRFLSSSWKHSLLVQVCVAKAGLPLVPPFRASLEGSQGGSSLGSWLEALRQKLVPILLRFVGTGCPEVGGGKLSASWHWAGLLSKRNQSRFPLWASHSFPHRSWWKSSCRGIHCTPTLATDTFLVFSQRQVPLLNRRTDEVKPTRSSVI